MQIVKKKHFHAYPQCVFYKKSACGGLKASKHEFCLSEVLFLKSDLSLRFWLPFVFRYSISTSIGMRDEDCDQSFTRALAARSRILPLFLYWGNSAAEIIEWSTDPIVQKICIMIVKCFETMMSNNSFAFLHTDSGSKRSKSTDCLCYNSFNWRTNVFNIIYLENMDPPPTPPPPLIWKVRLKRRYQLFSPT